MDKMKEGLQRRARRMQENLQQSVGLSEKRDELQSVSHVEHRNQKIVAAVKNTRLNLLSSIRSVNKDESIDKRKRRCDEFGLWQQLQIDARELENACSRLEPSLLSEILRSYSDVVGFILEERVLTDQIIEKSIIEPLGKYIDDEKMLSKAREKLVRTVVDVEVIRKRRNANHDEAKAQEIQEEYDILNQKLEHYKDNIFTDIYTLCSKETEIASIYRSLIETQLLYHRSAVQKLENVLPCLDEKITFYRRRPVFGCDLDDHLNSASRSVAFVLEVCCSALVRIGLAEKGLFRVNGNNNRIRRMKAAFDAHQFGSNAAEINEYICDPHSVCSVLKCYLRELPDPLLTRKLHADWIHAARLEPDLKKGAVQYLLSLLPESNRINLAYLIRFLQYMLDYEEQTMMGVANLAIVFGPNLVDCKSNESENMLGSKIVETLLLHADFFFPNDFFTFDSSITSSFNQRHTYDSSGSEIDKVPARSAISMRNPSNNSFTSSTQSLNGGTSVVLAQSARTRPKLPAPPPPSNNYNANMTRSHIEENCGVFDDVNISGKECSPTVSMDSSFDYGSTNSVVYCDDAECTSLARSLHEYVRPIRPPQPLSSLRSISPDRISFVRPSSYVNAVCVIDAAAPPHRTSNPSSAEIRGDRVTVLELESYQHSPQLITTVANVQISSKPPLPVKPKPSVDAKPNEMTKL